MNVWGLGKEGRGPLAYLRRFAGPLYRFATVYIGLIVILLFLYALIFGLIGAGLGVPNLFWHEDFLSRVRASAGATLLLAMIGVTAFYLDRFPLVTGVVMEEWLRHDELLAARVTAWWRRVLRLGPRGLAAGNGKLQPFEMAACVVNAMAFDWILSRLCRSGSSRSTRMSGESGGS